MTKAEIRMLTGVNESIRYQLFSQNAELAEKIQNPEIPENEHIALSHQESELLRKANDESITQWAQAKKPK